MIDFSDEIYQKFQELTSRLSPENLSCDGELTRTQTRARYRQIMKEWKALEKDAGRSVTEDEIENEWLRRYHNE